MCMRLCRSWKVWGKKNNIWAHIYFIILPFMAFQGYLLLWLLVSACCSLNNAMGDQYIKQMAPLDAFLWRNGARRSHNHRAAPGASLLYFSWQTHCTSSADYLTGESEAAGERRRHSRGTRSERRVACSDCVVATGGITSHRASPR